jgi:hypothetical protein
VLEKPSDSKTVATIDPAIFQQKRNQRKNAAIHAHSFWQHRKFVVDNRD